MKPQRSDLPSLLRCAREALIELASAPLGVDCMILGILPVRREEGGRFFIPEVEDGTRSARECAVWAATLVRDSFRAADARMGDASP